MARVLLSPHYADFVCISIAKKSMQRRHRTVTDLIAHERSKAIGITDEEFAQKLTTMGLLPGSVIEMVRKAPFGGAFFVKVDGKNFALRNEEAASILIEA